MHISVTLNFSLQNKEHVRIRTCPSNSFLSWQAPKLSKASNLIDHLWTATHYITTAQRASCSQLWIELVGVCRKYFFRSLPLINRRSDGSVVKWFRRIWHQLHNYVVITTEADRVFTEPIAFHQTYGVVLKVSSLKEDDITLGVQCLASV